MRNIFIIEATIPGVTNPPKWTVSKSFYNLCAAESWIQELNRAYELVNNQLNRMLQTQEVITGTDEFTNAVNSLSALYIEGLDSFACYALNHMPEYTIREVTVE